MVIDSSSDNTSSRIAAGIFNPVTGRKMTRTWLAEQLFPALHTFYKEAEGLTGSKFFHPMPVYRPFLTIEEQNEWMGKSSDPEYATFIHSVLKAPSVPGVNDPLGGLLLAQGGYLDTNGFVEGVRQLMIHEQVYQEGKIDPSVLTPGPDGVGFGGNSANHVIFCTGVHASPWFGWLPIRPLKGETLEVSIKLRHEWIVNRGAYLVPQGSTWRAGATYSHDDQTTHVTEKSLIELKTAVGELVHLPFDVEGQQWGLRPTTPDRRPILGRHPEALRLWTLNGLGTKGVSLAPYFSGVLIDAIENGTPLNKDVNVERYKSLYWSSLT